MLTTPKGKGGLFLASSLCDGLEDNDIKQVTTLLLNKDADPNVLLPSHGVTPFHLVIGNDSETFAEEVTKLFLRHGGNPNVRSSEGLTPVHVAAAWGRTSVLELLLANGGDPLCIDDEGRNPFHYAFDGKYYKAITILGKYCEENFEEDKNIKYTRAFDKLVIKNGDVMAEYVSPEGADIKQNDVWNNGETELSHKAITSSPNDKVSSVSPQIQQSTLLTYNQNVAKLKIEQMMEEEKCLMNKIIDQLSTSLKSKDHKDTATLNCNVKSELNDTFLSTNTDEKKTPQKYNYRNKDEILKKSITKQLIKTPKHGSHNGYKRTRDFTGRVPLSPLHYRNDPILSKSPNLIINSDAYVKKSESSGYLSPRRPENQRPHVLKTFTPTITKCNDSNRFDHLRYVNKECPRSTPRRKPRFYHHHRTPLRKLSKNIRPSDTWSSSTDSATSLSPDNSYSSKRNKRFIDGRLIMKLDEAKYDDEDVIEQSRDIGSLNRGLASLNIIEKGQQLQKNDSSDSYQKKLQDTSNFFHSKTKHSSGFSSNESFESLNNYAKDDAYQLVIPAHSYSDLNFNKIHLASQVANHCPNNINDDCSSLASFRSARSFVSVQEDYKYEDADEGVAFLERRLYVVPSCKSLSEGFDSDTTDVGKMDHSGLSGHLPFELQFITNEALRQKLTDLGDSPGPITVTTRNLYLKRLITLKTKLAESNLTSQKPTGSPEKAFGIKSSLAYGNWINNLDTYKFLEKNTFQEFANPDPTRRWREGINKTSFNYLLLDPRITKDLPYRAIQLSESEIWNVFISAIFYVGKGKRSRPYAHLYDAFSVYCHNQPDPSANKKIQRILDVWNDGYGVVCLHVFQNTIPVEAYTREAAMIEALGLDRLGNKKSGDYYGRAATWNSKEKLSFGRYLLYKAMQILIHEGERQLFPDQL